MKSILKTDEVNRAQGGPRELKDPRSRDYAIQTLYALKRYAESLRCDQELVQKELAEIERYRHWEVLGYPSKDVMLAAELNKQGFSRVQDLATNPPDLKEKKTAGPGRGNKTVYNINGFKLAGTGASYLTARIARDAERNPKIAKVFAQMKAGKYKSVRAAAIAAGIVTPDTPLILLQRAWARAAESEQKEFIKWIKQAGK